jgi:hypothetical protein
MKYFLIALIISYTLSAACAQTDASAAEAADCTCVGASCVKTEKCQTNTANKYCLDATSFEPKLMAGTLNAMTSVSDPTCVAIAADAAFCRLASNGTKSAGFKKSATDAACGLATDCKGTNNQATAMATTNNARTSNSDATCVVIGANDKKCRNTSHLLVASGGVKKSATDAECITAANKCGNATTGIQEDNTGKKARTSDVDGACKTIADDAKECRDTTSGVATANKMKTSSTDFVCVASATKCGDANGVQSDIGALKIAKTSSTNDVCKTIANDAKECIHATTGVATANKMKTSSTNFTCVASATKCGDANGVQSDIGALKIAKTSSTNDVCVTIADDAKECIHASTGVATANRMKTSSTNFTCVADVAKCSDANGIQSANTGMKAKTSSSDDLCFTVGSNVKKCRNAAGVLVTDGAVLTSTTDVLCVVDLTKCAHATTGVTTANTLKVARVSSTDASCETITADGKFCRHATTGVKTANRMKTSDSEFLCVAAAAKCSDANGIQSDNTLKKAKTSSSDDLCKTIADDAKECRHATSGVATANKMKTSTTEFACVANVAKCGDANGIVSDATLKIAKTSSTNDVCVTIADDAKSCRNASSGVLVTSSALKKSATDFECVTNAAKCGDASAQLVDNTGLKARTSGTDATCVDLVAISKDCRNSSGVKTVGIKEDISGNKAACQANWGHCSGGVVAECLKKDASAKSAVNKCKCGSAECVKDD